MGVSIDDLIGRVKMPVRSVAICLDADLQAEHDQLNEELERLHREGIGSKMGDGGKTKALADRIVEIEEAMRESEQTFKFKGLNKNALNVLYKRFPSKDKTMLWDSDAGAHALLAAAAIEPEMDEKQAESLIDALSMGQLDKLVSAAWVASTGSSNVPLSVRASGLRSGSS